MCQSSSLSRFNRTGSSQNLNGLQLVRFVGEMLEVNSGIAQDERETIFHKQGTVSFEQV